MNRYRRILLIFSLSIFRLLGSLAAEQSSVTPLHKTNEEHTCMYGYYIGSPCLSTSICQREGFHSEDCDIEVDRYCCELKRFHRELNNVSDSYKDISNACTAYCSTKYRDIDVHDRVAYDVSDASTSPLSINDPATTTEALITTSKLSFTPQIIQFQ